MLTLFEKCGKFRNLCLQLTLDYLLQQGLKISTNQTNDTNQVTAAKPDCCITNVDRASNTQKSDFVMNSGEVYSDEETVSKVQLTENPAVVSWAEISKNRVQSFYKICRKDRKMRHHSSHLYSVVACFRHAQSPVSPFLFSSKNTTSVSLYKFTRHISFRTTNSMQ